MNSPNPKDRGMTLMELIVVLAVFSLVAILSLQALSGTLRHRDRLVELDTKTADLTLMLSLLRADLNAALPMSFNTPEGEQRSAFDISPARDMVALSVSGKFDLSGESSAGLGRVIWRFDPDQSQLIRQSWPVLIPADFGSLSPEVIVAKGITGMEIRTMTSSYAWVSGDDPTISGVSSSLPRAVQVVLQTTDFGRITTLVGYP
jgi:general secretion pathway protein J